MHTLIIDCTSFLLHLVVYALNADGEVYKKEYVSADNIAKYAASDHNIKNIKISGPAEYCLGLKEELENTLVSKYAINNIEIEVM